MLKIQQGNFKAESQQHRQWIMGHFLEPGSPFHNTNFEVKLAKHPQGEIIEQKNSKPNVKTLAILIYGKFSVKFIADNKTLVLEKEADYLFYDQVVPHIGTALADSLLVVIRWPSIA